MSIAVADLMGLAQQLAAGNSESEWRSGASRAYYGAFHKTLAVADACLPANPQAIGEHERLTDRLKQQGMKGRALAYILIDLKKVRTHADYFLGMQFDQNDANDQVAGCAAYLPRADAFESFVKSGQAAKP